MNQLSSENAVKEHEKAGTPTTSRTMLILTVWLGTLLLSRFPQIILSEMGIVASSDWNLWWWIIAGAALIALTYLWTAVSPLRSYFLIMTMIYVVTIGLSAIQQTSIWVSWFGPEKTWLIRSLGDRVGVVLMALALAGILVLLGKKRESFFLAFGDVNARAEGMGIRWKIAGPL
ncbi:MAG TPA: hypothetical protein PLR65_09570, partial [Anaerolineales bacterium]|nr:hypothetical protein [Anaerolineales bacterium]